MKHEEIRGLAFIGYVHNPRINHGAAVPVYEPKEPEGRPSINTLEGWNALVKRSRAHKEVLG